MRYSRLFVLRLFILIWLQIIMGLKTPTNEPIFHPKDIGSETYIFSILSHGIRYDGENSKCHGSNLLQIWSQPGRVANKKKQRNKVSFFRKKNNINCHCATYPFSTQPPDYRQDTQAARVGSSWYRSYHRGRERKMTLGRNAQGPFNCTSKILLQDKW